MLTERKLVVAPSDRASYLATEYLNGVKYFSNSYELVKNELGAVLPL
jgi:hypothetical protein